MGFEIKIKLTVRELNKFYKRDTTPFDYIFVGNKVVETDTYFYHNFNDFDSLFYKHNNMLICDKKYIDENFTEITLDKLQSEISRGC